MSMSRARTVGTAVTPSGGGSMLRLTATTPQPRSLGDRAKQRDHLVVRREWQAAPDADGDPSPAGVQLVVLRLERATPRLRGVHEMRFDPRNLKVERRARADDDGAREPGNGHPQKRLAF